MRRYLYYILFPILFPAFTAGTALGQTCSCGGAPLISSQTSGATGAGNLLAGFTYEYHDISSLYSGTSELRDNTVERNTKSALLELHYGITDRLSVSGTFTWVAKSRTTGLQLPGGRQTLQTSGIGDGLMILKYTVLQQSVWLPAHLSVGGGTKAPIGSFSLANDGFLLNADMQPGTGSWDAVLWSYAATSFRAGSTFNMFWQTSYRHTGTGERFGEDDLYQFGNELVSSLGVSGQIAGNLSYMMQLRYRSTSTDRLNDSLMPNTGGKWVSVVPALNYAISDLVTLRLSGRAPVYQHLSGTQPTTSYALSGSLFLNFNKSDGEFNYGMPN